jgi:hypothetical protein
MEYAITIIITPVMFAISVLLRHRIFLPLLCSIPACAGYLLALRSSTFSAFSVVIIWTLIQSFLVIYSAKRKPDSMKNLIVRSEAYTRSMFDWIETGQLPEGKMPQVIQSHLQQTILYCFLAFITANLGSIVLGCVLLNYMNFYVSQLSARSRNSGIAILLGWNFWSVIRVLSYLWLGVILGIPLASYLVNVAQPFQWVWLVPGFAGVILDLFLKIYLSNWWRKKLALLLG